MKIKEKLASLKEEDYGSDYRNHILEIYKTYVQAADAISSRRQSSNSFFLTVNIGIIGAAGYFSDKDGSSTWIVSLAGAILCYVWYRLVRSYKDLNSAKFKVIHEIEKELPISPYEAEWEAVGRGNNSDLYLPFTRIELWIPRVFLAVHCLVVLVLIPWDSLVSCLPK